MKFNKVKLGSLFQKSKVALGRKTKISKNFVEFCVKF